MKTIVIMEIIEYAECLVGLDGSGDEFVGLMLLEGS